MISKIPELQTFPLNLRFAWGWEAGGGGGKRGGQGPDPLHRNLKFNGKNGALESWQIIISLPILLDLLAYLPINTLIQELTEFICVKICKILEEVILLNICEKPYIF